MLLVWGDFDIVGPKSWLFSVGVVQTLGIGQVTNVECSDVASCGHGDYEEHEISDTVGGNEMELG